MSSVPSITRRTTPTVAARSPIETREAIIADAAAHGWDVIERGSLRCNRGTVTIEVWFADDLSRVVRARHIIDGVQTREIDIVNNRAYRLSLSALVMQWLGVREAASRSSNRAHTDVLPA